MVSLKIRCGDDIRRISVDKDITFRDLVLQLRQIFRVEQNEELVVKYVDDEGDKVTLSSDVEFKEALQCCKEPIQLVVSKHASGTIAAPQPVLDNLDLSLSQLLHVEHSKNEEKRAEEAKRQEEELLRKTEEAARRQEEAIRKLHEEKRRAEEEAKKQEEELLRRVEEAARRQEEEVRRLREEEKRIMEQKRLEEENKRRAEEEAKKRAEEEAKLREEEMKRMELQRQIEDRRFREEERKRREAEELRMKEEEQKKKEEEERKRRMEELRKKKEAEEEELRKKKEAEERKIRENSKPKPIVSKVEAAWVEYKARNGRTVLLDLSSAACARFGVRTYQRVKTPAGAGTVIGVDQEHGFLWFQLDKDMKEGVSYWDDIHDHDSMICKGITPTEETALQHAIPLPKASEAMINSIQNPSEKEMMLRAIQQSLIDQQQQEIKEYYASLEASKNQQ